MRWTSSTTRCSRRRCWRRPGRRSDTFVLDLSRVGFLSASGCRALAAGTRRFRDAGGCVLLADPVPFVKQILRLDGSTGSCTCS
ncbi:MAG: STAS domain-containing protein [Streptosporangiaceae bacterium]